MGKDTILATLRRLEQSRVTNIPIIIEVRKSSVKQLVKTLLDKKKIRKIKDYKNSCFVKLSTGVNRVEALAQTITVKKDEILEWSAKLLDNEEGHLIMTTTKGVISHREAIHYKIGGEILGLIL